MQNKWDKDYTLYRAFDMDGSFFVQSSYLKSKHGRALLSNFFSKQSICELQHLIRGMVRVHLPFFTCQLSYSHSSWTNSAIASRPKTGQVSSSLIIPLVDPLRGVQESPAIYISASNASAPTRSPISVLLLLSISSLSRISAVTLCSALTLPWTHLLCGNSPRFLFFSSVIFPMAYLPAYRLR